MAPSPRTAAAVVTLVLMVPVLSGCFGDVEAAYVPDSAVPSGWKHATENATESLAGGQLKIVFNEYAYDQTTKARVYLVSATDVPVVSEREVLTEQIMEFASGEGVTLTKTGTSKERLESGVTVNVDKYDIEKRESWGKAKGKAWVISYEGGEFFVGGIGFSTTEVEAVGLVGGGTQDDTEQWENVRAMIKSVDW